MKKKTEIEYFETKKYYCWLTGFGSLDGAKKWQPSLWIR